MNCCKFLVLFLYVLLLRRGQAKDCRQAEVDVVLLVDSSQSMDTVFQEQKKLALELAKSLPVSQEATRVCLIQYSKTPILKYPFTASQNNSGFYKVVSDLSDLGGETMTAEAIKFALKELASNGRRVVEKVLVLISDGNSFNSWKTVKETAKELQGSGAKVIVIALGHNIYMPELKLYAGEKGHVFTKESATKFEGLIADLVGEICGSSVSPIKIEAEPATTTVPVQRKTAKPVHLPSKVPEHIKEKHLEVPKVEVTLPEKTAPTQTAAHIVKTTTRPATTHAAAKVGLTTVHKVEATIPKKTETSAVHTTPHIVRTTAKATIHGTRKMETVAHTTRHVPARTIHPTTHAVGKVDTTQEMHNVEHMETVAHTTRHVPARTTHPTTHAVGKVDTTQEMPNVEHTVAKVQPTTVKHEVHKVKHTTTRKHQTTVKYEISKMEHTKAKVLPTTVRHEVPRVESTTVKVHSNTDKIQVKMHEKTEAPVAVHTTPCVAATKAAAQTHSVPVTTPQHTETTVHRTTAATASETRKVATTHLMKETVATVGKVEHIVKATTEKYVFPAKTTTTQKTAAEIHTAAPTVHLTTKHVQVTTERPINVHMVSNTTVRHTTAKAEAAHATTREAAMKTERATSATHRPHVTTAATSARPDMVHTTKVTPVVHVTERATTEYKSAVTHLTTKAAVHVARPETTGASAVKPTVAARSTPATPAHVATSTTKHAAEAAPTETTIAHMRETAGTVTYLEGQEKGSTAYTKWIPLFMTGTTVAVPVVKIPEKGCLADVIFVLDASDSVKKAFPNQVQLVADIISSLKIGKNTQRVAAVEYSSQSVQKVLFSFDNFTTSADAKVAIEKTTFFSGTTFIGEGLKLVQKVMRDRRPGIPLFIVLLTDGIGYDDFKTVAKSIRSEPDVVIAAVSLETIFSWDGLASITGNPYFVFVQGDSDIRELKNKLEARVLKNLVNCQTESCTTASMKEHERLFRPTIKFFPITTEGFGAITRALAKTSTLHPPPLQQEVSVPLSSQSVISAMAAVSTLKQDQIDRMSVTPSKVDLVRRFGTNLGPTAAPEGLGGSAHSSLSPVANELRVSDVRIQLVHLNPVTPANEQAATQSVSTAKGGFEIVGGKVTLRPVEETSKILETSGIQLPVGSVEAELSGFESDEETSFEPEMDGFAFSLPSSAKGELTITTSKMAVSSPEQAMRDADSVVKTQTYCNTSRIGAETGNTTMRGVSSADAYVGCRPSSSSTTGRSTMTVSLNEQELTNRRISTSQFLYQRKKPEVARIAAERMSSTFGVGFITSPTRYVSRLEVQKKKVALRPTGLHSLMEANTAPSWKEEDESGRRATIPSYAMQSDMPGFHTATGKEAKSLEASVGVTTAATHHSLEKEPGIEGITELTTETVTTEASTREAGSNYGSSRSPSASATERSTLTLLRGEGFNGRLVHTDIESYLARWSARTRGTEKANKAISVGTARTTRLYSVGRESGNVTKRTTWTQPTESSTRGTSSITVYASHRPISSLTTEGSPMTPVPLFRAGAELITSRVSTGRVVYSGEREETSTTKSGTFAVGTGVTTPTTRHSGAVTTGSKKIETNTRKVSSFATFAGRCMSGVETARTTESQKTDISTRAASSTTKYTGFRPISSVATERSAVMLPSDEQRYISTVMSPYPGERRETSTSGTLVGIFKTPWTKITETSIGKTNFAAKYISYGPSSSLATKTDTEALKLEDEKLISRRTTTSMPSYGASRSSTTTSALESTALVRSAGTNTKNAGMSTAGIGMAKRTTQYRHAVETGRSTDTKTMESRTRAVTSTTAYASTHPSSSSTTERNTMAISAKNEELISPRKTAGAPSYSGTRIAMTKSTSTVTMSTTGAGISTTEKGTPTTYDGLAMTTIRYAWAVKTGGTIQTKTTETGTQRTTSISVPASYRPSFLSTTERSTMMKVTLEKEGSAGHRSTTALPMFRGSRPGMIISTAKSTVPIERASITTLITRYALRNDTGTSSSQTTRMPTTGTSIRGTSLKKEPSYFSLSPFSMASNSTSPSLKEVRESSHRTTVPSHSRLETATEAGHSTITATASGSRHGQERESAMSRIEETRSEETKHTEPRVAYYTFTASSTGRPTAAASLDEKTIKQLTKDDLPVSIPRAATNVVTAYLLKALIAGANPSESVPLHPSETTKNTTLSVTHGVEVLPTQKTTELLATRLEEQLFSTAAVREKHYTTQPGSIVLEYATETATLAEAKLNVTEMADIEIKCPLHLLIIIDSSECSQFCSKESQQVAIYLVKRLISHVHAVHISFVDFSDPSTADKNLPITAYRIRRHVSSADRPQFDYEQEILNNRNKREETFEHRHVGRDIYGGGNKPNHNKVIAVVTHGGFNPEVASKSSQNFREEGAAIYAIYVGRKSDINTKPLTSLTGSQAQVYAIDDLEAFYKELVSKEASSC